jgi:hypothetical protein
MVGTVIAKVAGSALGATYTMPAADGAAGEFLKTDGSTNLSFASAAAGFHQVVVKTSSDATYSPAAGVTKIVVHLQGGGGGTGNATGSDGSAGGGGGAYAMKQLTVTSSYVINVQIGAAGTTGATGGNGGDTTFTYVSGGVSFTAITAGGGLYGQVNNVANGGEGGTATNGDLNVRGGDGGRPAGGSHDAPGGSSMFGFGGQIEQAASGIGNGYGAGASGNADGTGFSGKAGTAGLAIIYEYK